MKDIQSSFLGLGRLRSLFFAVRFVLGGLILLCAQAQSETLFTERRAAIVQPELAASTSSLRASAQANVKLLIQSSITKGFFETRQQVANQSRSESKRAMRRGIVEVLQRLSGQRPEYVFAQQPSPPAPVAKPRSGGPDAEGEEGSQDRASVVNQLKIALANPENYAIDYSFHASKVGATKSGLELRVRFEGALLKRLLYDSGMPVWEERRHPLLVWLTINDGSGLRYLSDETAPEIMALLREQMRRYGLSIAAPTFDDRDRQAFSLSAARRGNLLIGNSSRVINRYAARGAMRSSLLTGSIFRSLNDQGEETWRCHFYYFHQNQKIHYQSLSIQLEESIAQVVKKLATNIFEHHVQHESAAFRELELVIENVQGFAAFNYIESWLLGLSSVRSVRPIAIHGSQIRLLVGLRGYISSLEQALQSNKRLQAANKTQRLFSHRQRQVRFFVWRSD